MSQENAFISQFGSSGGGGGAGIQGLQGTQGVQGVQGNLGTQGSTGSGAQGTQGVQGERGEIGLQGIQGLQGEIGAQGSTGAGIQGVQGVQGLQGDIGAQGTTGAGIQGVQGVQGLIGSQGIQGAGGVVGYFGSFFSTQDQTATTINTETLFTYNFIIRPMITYSNVNVIQTETTILTPELKPDTGANGNIYLLSNYDFISLISPKTEVHGAISSARSFTKSPVNNTRSGC